MTISAHHENVSPNPDVGVRFYYSVMSELDFVPLHWHRSLEIIYVIHGELLFSFNGYQSIITDGQFLAIPSGIIHSVQNKPNESYVLQIPIDFIEQYLPNAEQTIFKLDKHSSEYDTITNIFLKLGQIYANKNPGYQLLFQANILILVYSLFIKFGITEEVDNTNMDNLKEVLRYLNQHYSEKISIAEVARIFSYNPNYISRLFKQQIGVTPVQYLYQIIINAFYHDVIETNLPIHELLLKNGLTNKRLALKYFKESYQTTPLQARKQKNK
jgi:AraC-like DNA-binding protein